MLVQAGIRPRTPIERLDETKLEQLFRVLKVALRTAIEHQARPDRFPETFVTPRRRGGRSFSACGADLERVKASSRRAYYCPNRQRKEGGWGRRTATSDRCDRRPICSTIC